MRTLSSALSAAYGAAVQKPAYLIEIGFAATVRLSTYGTVTYDGETWIAGDCDISGLRVEQSRISGTLRLPNADNTYGALILTDGTTDRRIRIWGYDAAATAAGDFVQLVDGVGGAATVDSVWASIAVRDAVEFVSAPRGRVNAASGFTYLLPAGALVALNGSTYRIERK